MKCPQCLSDQTRITDSRPSKEGFQVRRRRECEKCGYRFTTAEVREVLDLMVVKKSGEKQRYSREKLMRGLTFALEKRPVTKEKIMDMCMRIEVDLLKGERYTVPTKEIGDTVLKHLREFDEVAYIRFASVYRDFRTIKGFKREIDKFLKET
jgi:transcriptional repressor NrdR